MYTLVLTLHSWLRWLAIVAGIAATVTAASDRSPAGGRSRADLWGLIFMMVLDIQMLLGLLLYLVLSDITKTAMQNFGAAMRVPVTRFFAVEHVTLTIAAVILVHVGKVMARRATSTDARRMRMLLCFGLATALILLAIPWPGMPAERPLFRF
jgi:hypothetical protein